jgi:hypothetical protein
MIETVRDHALVKEAVKLHKHFKNEDAKKKKKTVSDFVATNCHLGLVGKFAACYASKAEAPILFHNAKVIWRNSI